MKKVSRAGRKQQIVTLLKSENRMLTSYELARKLGAKPSWFWRQLFVEMWHERMIAACSVRLANGKEAFYWGDSSMYPQYVTAEMQGCTE